MLDRDEERVLTEAPWVVLALLIEACRPAHKTKHHNVRRTIGAILWRHESGAKWRHIPAALGPRGSRRRGCRPAGWWRAAPTFNRWRDRGA